MRIGIPEALLYYNYYPFWKTFFEGLGQEVVLSGKTNNPILDKGVKNCVDDACLPVKLFHGHVMALIGKVDKIFIPRLISVQPGEYICPKFIGLPEMIKNSVPNLPPLIVMNFNAFKHLERGYDGCKIVGKELGASVEQVVKALSMARKVQEAYDEKLLKGANPATLLDKKEVYPILGEEIGCIALIGHPYLLYDRHISMDIVRKLAKRGYRVLLPENITLSDVDAACAFLPKKLFWSYGKRLLGSGLHMLAYQPIQGMIFMTSFGCGIDSFVGELLQRYNQREYLVPYCTITLDEHSGHAGFDTRLEAFIDMMEWRKNNGHHLPAYGQDVYASQSNL